MSVRIFFGYSLIELLLVLAIIASFTVMAITTSRELYQSNVSQVVVNRLLNAIQLARMQAITYGDKVTLCGSSNGLEWDENWQAGQIIINTKTHKLLRAYSALPRNVLLNWHSSGRQPYLTFQANGFTNGQQGRFNICISGKAGVNRAIIINHSGRPRISNDSLCPL